MIQTQCFMIEETGQSRLSLRRYREESECPLTPIQTCHNASRMISVVPTIYGVRDSRRVIETRPEQVPPEDPRWPTHCECGESFIGSDVRQVFQETLWSRVGTNEEMTLREWQKHPGAMWDAWWYHPMWLGPDGRSLCVVLPDGREWSIDSPAKGTNTPWARTGVPPKITANPSILTPGYHGWMRDGVLVSC